MPLTSYIYSMRLIALLLCLIAPLATAAIAAPQAYRLDAARSVVGFDYNFEGAPKQGWMPVKSADIQIDLDNVAASRVDVVLDAAQARAGFIFATQAMKSAAVLNTAAFPDIRFRSTSISGSLTAATVRGELTVRGVTRPVILHAGLYRQRGTDLGDRDNLTVLLTGALDRAAFGAGGYPNFVDNMIGLRIIARISK